jgi:phage terminase large subunit
MREIGPFPHKDFKARFYQEPVWAARERGVKKISKVWHRGAGKDFDSFAWMVTAASQRVGQYWYMFPQLKQGRRILWNGATNEGRRFLSYIPRGFIKGDPHDNEMRITCVNGSIIQIIGTDQNPEDLRGANPVGVVLSEWAEMDPIGWKIVLPRLNANGGWAEFCFTPKGKNHGYAIYTYAQEMMVKDGSWFCSRLTIDQTHLPDEPPIVTKEQMEEDKRLGATEAFIQQEYYVSFEAPVEHSFYGNELNRAEEEGRICELPIFPHYRVDTAWDLGWDGFTSIWFIQPVDEWYHVIDYYETRLDNLIHHVKALEQKPYVYGRHFGPHDLKQHDLSDTQRRSRLRILQELGLRHMTVVGKHLVTDRVNATIMMFPRCKFDRNRCQAGLNGLKSYRRMFDSKLGKLHDEPVEDWACHSADAFGIYGYARRDFVERPEHDSSKPMLVDEKDVLDY